MNPEVLNRARRGDPDAQELVISTVAPGLLRLATRLVSDPAEREDLVEEALYRGIVKLSSVRETGALVAWFRRILLNLWRDGLRKNATRPRPLVLESVPERSGGRSPARRPGPPGAARALRP